MLYALIYLILARVAPNIPANLAIKNVEQYYRAVALIESDMRGDAASKNSTASSYFQITAPAFETAKRRASRLGVKVEASYVGDLTYKGQMGLLFIDLYQRKGTDPYLALIACGDFLTAKLVYYKFHHTNPDKATKARADRIFKEVYYESSN